jgi:hypothetical protein
VLPACINCAIIRDPGLKLCLLLLSSVVLLCRRQRGAGARVPQREQRVESERASEGGRLLCSSIHATRPAPIFFFARGNLCSGFLCVVDGSFCLRSVHCVVWRCALTLDVLSSGAVVLLNQKGCDFSQFSPRAPPLATKNGSNDWKSDKFTKMMPISHRAQQPPHTVQPSLAERTFKP